LKSKGERGGIIIVEIGQPQYYSKLVGIGSSPYAVGFLQSIEVDKLPSLGACCITPHLSDIH